MRSSLRHVLWCLFFSLLLLPFSNASAQSDTYSGETWGIFIGIDQTQEGIGTGYGAQSAAEMHSLWVEQQQLNPPNSFLLLNEGATRSDFRRALFKLRTAHPDDQVVLYFAVPTQVGFSDSLTAAGHLIPHDGLLNPTADSSARLIPAEELADAVRTSPAQQVLVFIDAPFSGLHASGWPPLVYEDRATLPSDRVGKHLLVAGRWGDTFQRNPQNQSPFVASLVAALTTTIADQNQNNRVSFSELSTFVRQDVIRQTSGYQFVQIRSYEGRLDIERPLPAGAPVTTPSLDALPPARGDTLAVQLITTPISANVYIDNTLVGQTPFTWRAPQWTDANVHLHAPGYLPWEEVLTPDTDIHSRREVHLLQDRALLSISDLPSGHQAWINGELAAPSALNPLELTTGAYHVMIKKGDERVIDEHLMLDPETSTRLDFDYRFYASPALASFIFPGLGQYTDDARLKGIGFAVATFSTLAVAMGHNLSYQNRKDLYFEAQDQYLQARTRPAAHALRAEMFAQYDKVLEFNDKRYNTLLLAALIQGIGVLDALIFHSRKSELQTERKTELTPILGAQTNGLQFGVQIKL